MKHVRLPPDLAWNDNHDYGASQHMHTAICNGFYCVAQFRVRQRCACSQAISSVSRASPPHLDTAHLPVWRPSGDPWSICAYRPAARVPPMPTTARTSPSMSNVQCGHAVGGSGAAIAGF